MSRFRWVALLSGMALISGCGLIGGPKTVPADVPNRITVTSPGVTPQDVVQLPPPRALGRRGLAEGRRLLGKVHFSRTEGSTNGNGWDTKISRRVRTCTPSSASGSTKVGTSAIPIPFFRVGE